MAKDIQIKYINEQEQWEELYPKSKARIVETDSGQSVENVLLSKANKDETYTKTQVDDLISGFDGKEIPVSETEPADGSIWFEII